MKKGFTLIELLAVIIILSITSMIIFPNVTKVINNSKNDLYNAQVLDIQLAAEKWSSSNVNLLDSTHANTVYISLEALRFSGFLEPDPIKSPKDRSIMNGCIQVKYNPSNKKYNHVYLEKSCRNYASEENDEFGSIIYSYDRSAKKFVKDESSKEVVSTGLALYNLNQKQLKTRGQSDSGLYDLDSEYVFRGVEPNNFVTLTGVDGNNIRNTSWRVLSIDKENYKVKLISTTPIATNTWNNTNSISFRNSALNTLLLSKTDGETTYYTKKIINNDYQIGSVPSSESSIDALKSVLSGDSGVDNTSSQKVGTISVLDYVNASASDCDSNFLSNSCATNNYLKTMFGDSSTTWTLNTDGTQVWYVNTDGMLSLTSPVNNKQIYAVVTLDSNTYISNLDTATGTSTNPYIIK